LITTVLVMFALGLQLPLVAAPVCALLDTRSWPLPTSSRTRGRGGCSMRGSGATRPASGSRIIPYCLASS